MTSLRETEIRLSGIKEILMAGVLHVPPYQRSYAWREENVQELFYDITKAIDENRQEYFIGSIVIAQPQDGHPEIVDGQQRIATSIILIAAIRDIFKSLGQKGRADAIDISLSETDEDTLEKNSRLQLNELDHPFFQKFIIDGDTTQKPLRESNLKIKVAYDTSYELLLRYISASSAKDQKLLSVLKFIQNKLNVIKVQVSNQSNAYTIFETLNDRGIALSVADLLKNYLLSKSQNRLEGVKANWLEMVRTIEEEEKVVDFLRHYWSSVNGITREKDLFNCFKDQISNPIQAYDHSAQLARDSVLYSAIINPESLLWLDYRDGSGNWMKILNEMGLTQIRPLILSVLRSFSPAEVQKSMRLFVAWSVRFLVVGGHRGGVLEKNYADRAVEIHKGEISTAQQLLTKMNGIVPTDEAFQAAFKFTSVSKSNVARYYLRTLEMVYKDEAEPELLPNEDPQIVTLEHILPQTPSAAWGHFSPETAETYFQRLGNLALLTRKVNASIGNNGFAEKRGILLRSNFRLSQLAAENESWRPEEIDARQAILADLAVKAWPNNVIG